MAERKILFATDYSEVSDQAFRVAVSLAREEDALLLIAHVSEEEEYPVGELFDEKPEPSPSEIERLQAVVPPGPKVRFKHQLLYGEPGSVETTKPAVEIVKLAKQEDVGKIVLGTHGRTGLSHLLMGSVAEAVVRQAPCPVVTVKQPSQSAT